MRSRSFLWNPTFWALLLPDLDQFCLFEPHLDLKIGPSGPCVRRGLIGVMIKM